MFSYLPATPEDEKYILDRLGLKTVEEVFKDIPDSVRLKENLNLEKPKSELEVERILRGLSEHNLSADNTPLFLGAGIYDHYIPSTVRFAIGRSEFYTAYTPYQPEISQGTLQVIFEYQTMICELTGMDVANASMYDGASATAEAAIMSAVQTKRNKILCSDGINPQTKAVLDTYLRFRGFEIEYVPLNNGGTDLAIIQEKLDKTVASVIVQNPNFFGVIEELSG